MSYSRNPGVWPAWAPSHRLSASQQLAVPAATAALYCALRNCYTLHSPREMRSSKLNVPSPATPPCEGERTNESERGREMERVRDRQRATVRARASEGERVPLLATSRIAFPVVSGKTPGDTPSENRTAGGHPGPPSSEDGDQGRARLGARSPESKVVSSSVFRVHLSSTVFGVQLTRLYSEKRQLSVEHAHRQVKGRDTVLFTEWLLDECEDISQQVPSTSKPPFPQVQSNQKNVRAISRQVCPFHSRLVPAFS